MSTFCNIYLVDKINNWYCRKFQEKFQLTTPYWSMISSLLHLVGLGPRVYYTLTNFRGGGQGPLGPPSIRQCMLSDLQLVYMVPSNSSDHPRGVPRIWQGGGGQKSFFSDLEFCMSRSDMLRMAKPCALLGG